SRRSRKSRDRASSIQQPQTSSASESTTATHANDTPESTGAADAASEPAAGGGGQQRSSRRRRNRSRSSSGASSGTKAADNQESSTMNDDPVSVDEQADIIGEFLDGLLGAISIEADIARNKIDDDTIELDIDGGDDLGLLIGPKGQTVNAVHELSRTVLQRRA